MMQREQITPVLLARGTGGGLRPVSRKAIHRRALDLSASAAARPVDPHPPGTVHRLGNRGRIVLVEVQSGSCPGEDDIERLDDAFGRS